MKARVIVSATERKISPWLASIFSLLIAGLGEVYAGAPLSGIVFLLLRTMAILSAPFYSLTNRGEYMAEEIFYSVTACVFISVISPVHAFFISRKKTVLLSWYNSVYFYSAYTVAALITTLIPVIIFFSFFGLLKSGEDTTPVIREGDIIAVRKAAPGGYTHGDIVLADTGDGEKFLRVIGVPGEGLSYSHGRFISDGSELPLSIFTEEELRLLCLTDYDVISEQNGMVRYPVKGRAAEKVHDTTLAPGEYFLAPDMRENFKLFIKSDAAAIRGRVEGIILTGGRKLLPGKIILPAENISSR